MHLRRRRLAAVVIGYLMGQAAVAHHSFASFDMNSRVRLQGTVTAFEWTNPHTWVRLTVRNAAGVQELWSIEGQSPNNLVRLGWNKDSVKPGDKVDLVIHPLREGGKGGSLLSVVLASGQTLRMMEGPKPSQSRSGADGS